MRVLIAGCYSGAIDLYHGIPNLDEATFEGTEMVDDKEQTTILKFKLDNGEDFQIHIKPR